MWKNGRIFVNEDVRAQLRLGALAREGLEEGVGRAIEALPLADLGVGVADDRIIDRAELLAAHGDVLVVDAWGEVPGFVGDNLATYVEVATKTGGLVIDGGIRGSWKSVFASAYRPAGRYTKHSGYWRWHNGEEEERTRRWRWQFRLTTW